MRARSSESQECCIPSKDSEICTCEADDIISLISKKWAILIIRAISSSQKIGYNNLLRMLKGISPTSLADRLAELEKAGLVSRKVITEAPIRVEYTLTKEGQDFSKAISPLIGWSSKRNRGFVQIKS